MAAEETLQDMEAGAASGGLPQFDFSTWGGQLFWLAITFGIMYLLLSKFVLPAIGTGLTERNDRIADDLDSASRMQREAAQAEKAYDRALADAKAKAHNVAETTRKAVDAEIETELAAADTEAVRQAELAETRVRKIRDKALGNIDAIAQSTASAIVTKLTGKTPTPAQIKSAMKKA